jgi:hypothetical protein
VGWAPLRAGTAVVAGDPTATADRVRASAGLLRLAIAAEFVNCLMLSFAAFALYRLFRDVDRRLAVATAVLMWIAVPIQLLNLANDGAALMLTSSATYQSALTKQQVDALPTCSSVSMPSGSRSPRCFGACGSFRGDWPRCARASFRAGAGNDQPAGVLGRPRRPLAGRCCRTLIVKSCRADIRASA